MASELSSLLRLAEQRGDDTILDELVHDTAQEARLADLNALPDPAEQEHHISAIEAHASEINNGGFERQIEYLLQSGVAKQAVEEAITTGKSDQLQ